MTFLVTLRVLIWKRYSFVPQFEIAPRVSCSILSVLFQTIMLNSIKYKRQCI